MLRMALVLVALTWAGDLLACPGTGSACHVSGGDYDIAVPENEQQTRLPPVLVYLHGWGGRSSDVLQSDFAATFRQRGYAVVAPQGLPSEPGGNTDWSVRDGQTHPRDDVEFVTSVLADAVARFHLDQERVLLAGFSRGGSMVWDIACLAPGTARAYAPVAGGFWGPDPTSCSGPVQLLHTHGFADTTVPLEGRPLGHGAMTQSDIFEGLQIWRGTNGCNSRANRTDTSGRFWRKTWTDCRGGGLELVLHAGSHEVPDGWAQTAINWFEALPLDHPG